MVKLGYWTALVIVMSAWRLAAAATEGGAAVAAEPSLPAAGTGAAPLAEPGECPKEPETLTLGSTRETVRGILGEPDRIQEQDWFYGTSNVHFDAEGRIDGYALIDKDLKIVLRPSEPERTSDDEKGPPDPAREPDKVSGTPNGSAESGVPAKIGIGYTKDDVLRIWGTPRCVREDCWYYPKLRLVFSTKGEVKHLSRTTFDFSVQPAQIQPPSGSESAVSPPPRAYNTGDIPTLTNDSFLDELSKRSKSPIISTQPTPR